MTEQNEQDQTGQVATCKAVLNVISPSGAPLALHLGPEDDGKKVKDLLDKSEKLASWLKQQGWQFSASAAAGNTPSASELASGPTFCGYPCSPTVNDAGAPTWIIADGQQAMRREKQGDVWYSYKKDNGEYEQVLLIPKGDNIPPVKGLDDGARV